MTTNQPGELLPDIQAYLCLAWNEVAVIVAAPDDVQAKKFVAESAKNAGYDGFSEDEVKIVETIRVLESWAKRQDGWEIGTCHNAAILVSSELEPRRSSPVDELREAALELQSIVQRLVDKHPSEWAEYFDKAITAVDVALAAATPPQGE